MVSIATIRSTLLQTGTPCRQAGEISGKLKPFTADSSGYAVDEDRRRDPLEQKGAPAGINLGKATFSFYMLAMLCMYTVPKRNQCREPKHDASKQWRRVLDNSV
jgi:hypothetical protein